MKALLIMCGSQQEAGETGVALAQSGWNVVGTGPVDGADIRQGDDFQSHVPGSWAVFASREELQQP